MRQAGVEIRRTRFVRREIAGEWSYEEDPLVLQALTGIVIIAQVVVSGASFVFVKVAATGFLQYSKAVIKKLFAVIVPTVTGVLVVFFWRERDSNRMINWYVGSSVWMAQAPVDLSSGCSASILPALFVALIATDRLVRCSIFSTMMTRSWTRDTVGNTTPTRRADKAPGIQQRAWI